MDNSLFIKNILILIFCVILIHIFLNDFLNTKKCDKEEFQYVVKNNDNLKENIVLSCNNKKKNNKTIVYFFYADWCGHCKHFKPIFNQFKKKIFNNKKVRVIEVNADDKNPNIQELYKKYDIDGFPTTIIEKNNNFKKLVGKQDIQTLFSEVRNVENFDDIDFNTDNPDIYNKNNEVFKNKNNNNDTIVYNFNTTWCGHSKQFQPIWDKFSDLIKSYENVKAVDVKCDLDENIDFCNQFKVTSVPTIIIARNNELTPYEGSRNVEGLLNALKINVNNNELDNQVKINNNEDELENKFMLLENNNIKTKVYNFNTEWCKYSRDFQPEWNGFVNSLKTSDGIKAIDVKCDNEENKELCKKYDIPGYPSIVIETDNKTEIYNGARNALAIRKYLNL
jgi:thiol-disulfide isomerase/thioredoxin